MTSAQWLFVCGDSFFVCTVHGNTYGNTGMSTIIVQWKHNSNFSFIKNNNFLHVHTNIVQYASIRPPCPPPPFSHTLIPHLKNVLLEVLASQALNSPRSQTEFSENQTCAVQWQSCHASDYCVEEVRIATTN